MGERKSRIGSPQRRAFGSECPGTSSPIKIFTGFHASFGVHGRSSIERGGTPERKHTETPEIRRRRVIIRSFLHGIAAGCAKRAVPLRATMWKNGTSDEMPNIFEQAIRDFAHPDAVGPARERSMHQAGIPDQFPSHSSSGFLQNPKHQHTAS